VFARELRRARHPQGKPTSALELIPIAANQLAGSTLPLYSTAHRLREGGRTPHATSNLLKPKTKPWTETPPLHLGPVTIPPNVRRTFDLFRPTQLRARASLWPTPSTSSTGPTGSVIDADAAARSADGSGAGRLTQTQLDLLQR
jgi:hypothetical protein